MPVVQIDWLEGRDEEKKKRLFAGIANVFEELGIEKHKVHIIIHDIPLTDWGENGQPMSELKIKVKN